METKETSRTPTPITRQRCEIYSRIVGYIRPVSQWNLGKQAEFKNRVTFDKVLKEKISVSKRGTQN